MALTRLTEYLIINLFAWQSIQTTCSKNFIECTWFIKRFSPWDAQVIFYTLVSVEGCVRASIWGTRHGPVILVREDGGYMMNKQLCAFYLTEITII